MSQKPKIETDKRIRAVAVDDDPIILQLLESKLTNMGCQALLASDGAEAWSLILDKKPDIALVDLEMPNIDGIALIQCIRGHPRTKHLPVVVVTSRSDPAAIQNAFAAGATSFLTKPLQWTTFESHIQYLMRLTERAVQASARAARAEATVRVKDTVLRRALSTCSEGMSEARCLLAALRDELSSSSGTPATASKLETVIQICGDVEKAMRQTEALSKNLCGKIDSSAARVPLVNVLANAQAVVGPLSRECNVPVGIVRMPDHAYLACDAEKLSNALACLLDNAIRYAPSGTSVSVEVDVHEDYMLTIAVEDQGPGMEPDFSAAALAAFDDVAEVDISPEGVGLPLVKAVMESHGGALEIRSFPGEGTTALMVLPADRVFLEEPEYA
ncbi:MAG: response regulator [Pseudomonadota bacterium]